MAIKKNKNKKGFAAFLVIVIIAAATLVMAYSASILGIGELEQGYTSQQGEEAFSVADGCMEESFRRIRLDNGYSGGSLNLGDGSCIINIIPSGSDRTVTVTAIVSDYTKQLEANVTISSTDNEIIMNSWQEI